MARRNCTGKNLGIGDADLGLKIRANHMNMRRVTAKPPNPPYERHPPYAAAADLPIAAFTRGMTSSAINCMERLLSAGSTQSIPA